MTPAVLSLSTHAAEPSQDSGVRGTWSIILQVISLTSSMLPPIMTAKKQTAGTSGRPKSDTQVTVPATVPSIGPAGPPAKAHTLSRCCCILLLLTRCVCTVRLKVQVCPMQPFAAQHMGWSADLCLHTSKHKQLQHEAQ